MIGKLTGKIDSFESDHLILDVSGVGYVVYASRRTLSSIGQAGDQISLLINMQVREDAMTLYGFSDKTEQAWFKLLTSVQGVGAKAGLSILAATPADQLGFVIASQDKTALTRADGVGPKLAARILTELKDKVGQVEIFMPAATSGTSSVQGGAPRVTVSKADEDAVSALTNLGYARAEAYKAVMQAKSKANDNDAESVEILIRLALTELSA
ncbi:MAG: Holliday junction branch migration protein RuvA [Alphaproteobacteria bacterium]|nr:Holliday junction branch migration protein RuvA [Alphaproteobacteria bacterium]